MTLAEDFVDDSLTTWVAGVAATGLVTILGFLAKWVFSGVFKRLESLEAAHKESMREMVAEVRGMSMTVNGHATQLAVLQRDIGAQARDLGAIASEQKGLRERVDGLAEYWRREFASCKDSHRE